MDVCVTPSSGTHHPSDSVVDVCVTPRDNVSVKRNEDDKLSHQVDIPIENNCVQTHQSCHRERKITAVAQNNQEGYSNTCVQSKRGLLSLLPFEIYVLCDSLKTGIGNTLVDTGFQVSLVTERRVTK
jgi:hypothetical protein